MPIFQGFRSSGKKWTLREWLSNFVPVILALSVLYAFAVVNLLMAPGFVPTGWMKHDYEQRNGLQYGIVGESVKILSVRLVFYCAPMR